MYNNLKKKAIFSMFWSSLQRFGTMGISFLSNIILARLLSPNDYGCIGMLMIFMLVADTFVDGGFASALIQKKNPTQKDYSTVFFWNIFISLFIYVVLYLLSPYIASFYNIPLLSPVLRVQGIVLIINAFCIIQNTRLRKFLEFKKIAFVNLSSSLISVIIAIFLAYKGFGIWSLVAQQIIFSISNMILLLSVSKWFPSFIFSKTSFKELFGFGTFILLSNLFTTICDEFQSVLLGKYFNPSILGYYTQARKLQFVASTSLSNIINQVTYPIFSEYQYETDKLCNIIKKFTLSLSYITIPLMALLVILSRPLILFIYSSRWEQCIPYFQLLCVGGIALSLQGINYNAIAAIGKSKELFKWTIIKRIISVTCLFVLWLIWGLWGLLTGVVIGSYVIYLINALLVSKYIGYTLINQIKDLFPIVALSIILYMFIVVVTNNIYINMYIVGLLQLIMFCILYVFISIFFKFESAMFFKDTLIEIKNRIFK